MHLITPVAVALMLWFIYMMIQDLWGLFHDNWFMSVTMVFGSFIAGASSEGGGAVAFPVMTLAFGIEPEVARNFSLSIQSVGMTAAAYLIIRNRHQIEYAYLIPVSAGGVLGIAAGAWYIAPLVPPAYAKMLFVTFWLGFGIVLFYINHMYKREVVEALPSLQTRDRVQMGIAGVFGGILTAVLGSGIDIFSFSYVTMRYHLSEKVATPTSVVIMAFNAMVGTLIHMLFLRDISREVFDYWIVSVPVVLVGAPLGAYFISRKTRYFVSRLLYFIILAQFTGAVVILKPEGILLAFTVTTLLFGMLFFFWYSAHFLKKK
jgi:uncharacterized membrane protein YfcA